MNAATPFPWPEGSTQNNPRGTVFASSADADQNSAPASSDPTSEERLQAQRWEAIGRLTGGVVHDFNNLLTGIMLYCDLLLLSLDLQDRRRRYVDEVRHATVQAAGLVRQLMVFARPQSNSPHALCLNDIVLGMQAILRRLIGENITLELHLDGQLGAVMMDQTQVQQILLNLVLNARDALPAGGRVSIETGNCQFQPLLDPAASTFPCVLLVVGDNGHGMDAETRQRLFEPFFTTKNAGGGMGLGLTTVQSIVSSNHGLIHFESEPGRGTRAMILLPRAGHLETSLVGATVPDTPPPFTPIQPAKEETLL